MLILLLLTGCALLGVYALRLREERDSRQEKAEALNGRLAGLDSEAQFLERKCLQLAAEVTILSNRTVQTEARLQEEKKTNDPLRAKIQELTAGQIADKALLAERDALTKQQGQTLTQKEAELAALKGEKDTLAGRVQGLEAKHLAAASAESTLQAELAQAKQQQSQVAKRVQALEQEVAKLTADLKAQTARADGAEARIKELQK